MRTVEPAHADVHDLGGQVAPVIGRPRDVPGQQVKVLLIQLDRFLDDELLVFAVRLGNCTRHPTPRIALTSG